MATSQDDRERIIKGLFERLEHETDEGRTDRVVHLLHILENVLKKFADENQIEQFYEELEIRVGQPSRREE